ncbi:hypothetical protein NHX12_019474 [Muraenolepis orangiensis]|uniref:Fibronectin type-III domain-containing protein n=1 Tax=Muraenolepis orangiensis TaxID=630683 RepID=A0A9Q0IW31_9TELE|nr:hypothetical protein NHX12_019474 [Muraenolepis orangiensis]
MDLMDLPGVLLLACGLTLALSTPPSRGLTGLSCVFLERVNVTCHWDAEDPPGPAPETRYTLVVEKMSGQNGSLALIKTFNCSTSNTSCTANLPNSSVNLWYCVSVLTHRPPGGEGRQSLPRCQPGSMEVMLFPVENLSVSPIGGRPHCLLLEWEGPWLHPMTMSQINNGDLTSQMEYSTQGQQVKELSLVRARAPNPFETREVRFEACVFRPATTYSVRLRLRYKASSAPWSLWSSPSSNSTAEDAPSAAPTFWRRLLPAPVANGRVVYHNVSCRQRDGAALRDLGTCAAVGGAATSCHVTLPPGIFSCSVVAGNSVGVSPAAHLLLRLGRPEADRPPPNNTTATPLDEHSLDVRWTAPLDQSVEGFVVEWSAVTSDGPGVVHWERLKASQKGLVIRDGVEPGTRYHVWVTAVYHHGGLVPSTGPVVEMQDIIGNRLDLVWSPVPVEQRRGYIRQYAVFYKHADGHTLNLTLPEQVLSCSLVHLSPGLYTIYMRASTDEGFGEPGPAINVNIEGGFLEAGPRSLYRTVTVEQIGNVQQL